MKKLAILVLGVLSLVACTDQKLVKYNTARLDVIEDHLRNHKYVKPSENLDKLIEEGKNLTLTHKDIIRYFMTIPEAAQLVIEAATIGKGGEILILDMGEPVKIYDLAKNMIKLSGSNVGIDIVGLRPGEKLFEELLYDVNSSEKTSNNKIFITNMENEKVQVDIDDYYTILKDLIKNNDTIGMRRTLADIIGTFKGRVE